MAAIMEIGEPFARGGFGAHFPYSSSLSPQILKHPNGGYSIVCLVVVSASPASFHGICKPNFVKMVDITVIVLYTGAVFDGRMSFQRRRHLASADQCLLLCKVVW